jgi:protein-S-isoprenylcysteine O-methyltransferase Ste14
MWPSGENMGTALSTRSDDFAERYVHWRRHLMSLKEFKTHRARIAAALGSVAFLAVAPGIVAGVLPWYLTDGWTRNEVTAGLLLIVVGGALIVVGVFALIATFARYVIDGRGTPAPIAPTDELVVRGLNRYVRNPMYVAVVTVIIGQALVLAQPVLFVYAAVVLGVMAAFVRLYEEPVLRARYGALYDAYCARVRAWTPQRPQRS